MPGLNLEVGADVESHSAVAYQTADFQAGAGGEPVVSVVRQPLGTALFAGAYAQLHALDLAGWSVEAAARFDTFGVDAFARSFALEPRVAAQRSFDPVVVHFAAGFFHQPATTLIPLPAVDVVRARLPLQKVAKLEAGAEGHFAVLRNQPDLELGATVFVHPWMRMLELSPLDSDFQAQITRGPADVDPVLAARYRPGAGYGVELMAKRDAWTTSSRWYNRISAQLTYSFQQSWREVRYQRTDETGTPVSDARWAWVSSPLEVMHAANLVATYETSSGWKAGVTMVLRSGMPEAGGIASYTQREGIDAEGAPRWVPVDPDQVGRMPWFWRLDARVSKEWSFRRWSLEAYLDVLNVAFRQETVRYTYSEFAATQADRLAGNIELRRGELRLPVLLPMIGVTARL